MDRGGVPVILCVCVVCECFIICEYFIIFLFVTPVLIGSNSFLKNILVSALTQYFQLVTCHPKNSSGQPIPHVITALGSQASPPPSLFIRLRVLEQPGCWPCLHFYSLDFLIKFSCSVY